MKFAKYLYICQNSSKIIVMKILYPISVLLCLLPCSMKGQGIDSSKLATIEILVTDFKNNTKKGEQILFEGLNSKNIYKGISNAEGKFDIKLPGGDTYLIKIKSVGKARDYNKLKIPALNPGELYSPSQLTVKFELPRTFTLDNVHFDSGKPTLKKSSYPELKELLEFMTLKEKIIIEIAGHTDNVGDNAANLKLSQQRADAVRNYLISKGIASDRVTAKGYGEENPIETNNTEEGRKKNRRSEVRIIKEY